MAQNKLPSAVDVARFVLSLAAHDRKILTDKQLQKIIYYVQGLSLGRRDVPVFREEIRAWREGPVVREVYDHFRNVKGSVELDVNDLELPPLTRAFIASVWEDYKCLSERELINRTHDETPWIKARVGFRDHEPSDVLMTNSDMREFFSQPSANAIDRRDLRAIANRPDRAPPPSWYDETTDCTE